MKSLKKPEIFLYLVFLIALPSLFVCQDNCDADDDFVIPNIPSKPPVRVNPQSVTTTTTTKKTPINNVNAPQNSLPIKNETGLIDPNRKALECALQSKYIKLNKFNDLTLDNTFLLGTSDSSDYLTCLERCISNSQCIFAAIRQNRCYLCNENVIRFLRDSPGGNSLIYQKSDSRHNPYFRLTPGLIHYWPFENNVRDEIGNAHLYGGVNARLTNDRLGSANSALSLENGHYKVPPGVYFSGKQFTIMVWVKVRSFNLWSRILDFGNGRQNNVFFALTIDHTGNSAFAVLPGEVHSSLKLELNKWVHITAALNIPHAGIYINGVSYTRPLSAFGDSVPNVVRNTNFIGRSNWWPQNADANAEYDELKIFDRALSHEEINNEMNNNKFINLQRELPRSGIQLKGCALLSRYRRVNRYNDLVLDNTFLLGTSDSSDYLTCLERCISNSQCIFAAIRQNRCYLCNENVIRFLRDSPGGNSLIYQKSDSRHNPYFRLTPGLIHYWPFENNVRDEIGNAHLYGGVNARLTNDRLGSANSALSLENGHYKVPPGVYFSGKQFTIMVWVKVRSFNLWSRILDFGNGRQNNVFFALTIDHTGNSAFAVLPGEVHSSLKLELNKWVHITAALNIPHAGIYINGVSYTRPLSAFGDSVPNVVRNTNFIGRSNWWPQNADANAEYDELKIFDRALSQQEINNEMNNNKYM